MNKLKPALVHLFLALLLGTMIRLAYISCLDPVVHWPDEKDYMQLGINLAQGRGYTLEGEPTAFRAPGYPVFLAPWSLIKGWSVTSIRLLHLLVNAVIMLLVFMLAERFFSEFTAWIAVWIVALYPYYIFLTGTILSELWFILLLLAATYLILLYREKYSKMILLFSGFLMGGCILTRPSAVVLAAAGILWLLCGATVKKMHVFLFVLSLVLIVLPWMIRNKLVFDTYSLTTNSGRNLWLGNNEHTTLNSGSDIEMPDKLRHLIENSTEAQADLIFKKHALSFIKDQPLKTVFLWLGKGLALWRPDPSPTTGGYTKRGTLICLASYFSYIPVLLLAVFSWFAADKQKRSIMRLWFFYAVGFTLLHAVFISKVRFRLPLDVFLIMMAAYGVFIIYKRIFAAHMYDQK